MFKNHPKGLLAAALSNMGERFGYYIMNAVLVLFLCSKFGLSDEVSAIIYSVFYCGIYVLSLVGGIIADKSQKYKMTIMAGLIVMALGYVILSVPVLSTPDNIGWLLPVTCVALFLIAFGNGLFKGNLQAIVGQMYDNFEAEAALKGEDALREAKSRRDSGFQIFYVFINIGGLVAPFVAPLLREWWLKANHMLYNADLPALCHKFIDGAAMKANETANLATLAKDANMGETVTDMSAFCTQYLDVFNTGIHYSFIASVAAMLISLVIFIACRQVFPTPGKKEKKETVNYSADEKAAMAKEIKPGRVEKQLDSKGNQAAHVCSLRSARNSYLLLVLVPPERTVARLLRTRLRADRQDSAGDMAGNQPVLRDRAHAAHHALLRILHPPRTRNLDTEENRIRYGHRRTRIPLPHHLLLAAGIPVG